MLKYLQKYTSAAPLVVFRIVFGTMILLCVIRSWTMGWISDLYTKPKYFFPYYGFGFVQPLGQYTYWLFAFCGLCAIFVALGFFYRLSAIGLFLSFTYLELIDKTTYLNHYYFISLIILMLVFLPANIYFSLDAYRNQSLLADRIPVWCIDNVRLFVCIVYFYSGLAKLNSDWLLNALPLKMWLPAKNDIPIIGFLFNQNWIAYLFSWFGCLFDLSIGFLLWNKKTRVSAFATVVIFHVLTALLFPIGMFPFVMIVRALIFLPKEFHKKIISVLGSRLRISDAIIKPSKNYSFTIFHSGMVNLFLIVFFAFQLLFPFRYLLYPGELFWTEEGYRFSWRVMLIEKEGQTEFTVKDSSGHQKIVNNKEFLTTLQEKVMSTQPDMLIQYAQILKSHYQKQGFTNPQIYVNSVVTLNDRPAKPMVFPITDLAKEKDSFWHKSWIIPFQDEIKGL